MAPGVYAYAFDLTDALGRPPMATPDGIAATAAILDEMLARRTVPGRSADVTDDLAWIRAASGRAEHSDPRLPDLSSEDDNPPRDLQR